MTSSSLGAVTVVGFILSWIGGKWSQPPEITDSTSKAIVDVLQEQLARCGPAELSRTCPTCPEPPTPIWALVAGIVIGGLLISLAWAAVSLGGGDLVARYAASRGEVGRDEAVQLSLTGVPNAADIIRWTPPPGSRSRRV